ncbi:MAG TPA: hypothetical protein VIA06_05065 [Candidatus Dormibacteraeota bacterium]|jgi:hypothetical protein|nr:hypothetical protein [Candidatus Dormibacteraeota bacterium]
MPKRKERRDEPAREPVSIARAIVGDQLVQVTDLERVLYWLDCYGTHVERGQRSG